MLEFTTLSVVPATTAAAPYTKGSGLVAMVTAVVPTAILPLFRQMTAEMLSQTLPTKLTVFETARLCNGAASVVPALTANTQIAMIPVKNFRIV